MSIITMVSIRFIGKLLMIAIFLSSGAHKLATFNPATGGPLAGKQEQLVAVPSC